MARGCLNPPNRPAPRVLVGFSVRWVVFVVLVGLLIGVSLRGGVVGGDDISLASKA